MPEWTPLLPADPDALGPYRLEGRLGVGGQGTVYVGGATSGERVAVKLLHPHLITDERARVRFLGEVELAKRVAPFCTAQVLDSGVRDGQPYIVSEFVDGPSLQDSVRVADLRGAAALERLALNTATALAAIHQAGVVHRDFKPGNVLLGPDGPVVIDFGIARALDLSRAIITSQTVGTPGYMAPEQIEGVEIGPAADLFAWGATMVFAATGRPAFSGGSVPAVMRSILEDEPDLSRLDGRLRSIVLACLAKDPAVRPTAAEVADGLRAGPDGARTIVDPAAATLADRAEPDGRNGTGAEDGHTRGEGRLDGGAGHRRAVRAGAVVLGLLVVLGLAYTLIPSDSGGQGNGAGGPRSSARSGAPATADSIRRPTAPNPSTTTTPRTGASPTPEAGAESSPIKRIGTLSDDDVQRYCQSKGYAESGGSVSTYLECSGPGGEHISPNNVCRWAYPAYPNATAVGDSCMSR